MKKNPLGVLCALCVVALASCGPYKVEKYKDIGSNETAYHISLEQGTEDGQQMLRSVEYLEQKKVSAKRVYINQKKLDTGRMWGDFIYIPTDTVIIVNRAPVTEDWVDITLESKESIGFKIPVNCTASVLEESSSRFLYNFGGHTIGEVLNSNVKPYVISLLIESFGAKDLEACQNERNQIYQIMRDSTIKHFRLYGLEIINLGVSGELTYTDQAIQFAINEKFTSSMKKTSAQNEVDAANKFAQASESIRKQKELDADVAIKYALADAIKTGSLTWPGTLVVGGDGQGTSSLLELYGLQKYK